MIIDSHVHIFPETLISNRKNLLDKDLTFRTLFSNNNAKMVTAEDLIFNMDKELIDISLILSMGWQDSGIIREMNDYIIDSVKRYPDRLIGFAGVNPLHGNAAANEIDRCHKLGLSGIGELHPDTQGFNLSDKNVMDNIMEVVQENNMIVNTHSSEPVGHLYDGKGYTRPEVLLNFINNYLDTTIICSHWGGGLPFYSLMPEVDCSLKNVYFDTSATTLLYDRKIFDISVSLVGSNKILFGSDFPLVNPKFIKKHLDQSNNSEVDKINIFYENAKKIFRLESFI